MTRVPSPAGRAEASALAMLASAVAGAVGVVLIFEQEIGPATSGFLILGAWMVVVAVVGRRAGTAPAGPAAAIAAALYVGYPLWAYRVGRWMGAPALASVGTVT